jgi:putative PIN family toxin of toxin-antitoxin system
VEEAKNKRNAVRVVLDTNIVVSALLFARGRLAPIRLAWQSESFTALISTATTSELVRVLSYPKFNLTPADCDELLGDYLPFCTTVRIPAKPPKVPSCRDPEDLPFLQLATCGNAEYLASGDRDLLEIRDTPRFAIVNADTFIGTLNLSR